MIPITIGLSLRACERAETEHIIHMADYGLYSAHLIQNVHATICGRKGYKKYNMMESKPHWLFDGHVTPLP